MKLGYTKWKRVALLGALGLGVAAATGQSRGPVRTLRVAAASDLQPVMPAFASAYERETGVKLQVSFGSSSTLATQIVNGAPVDVFLGADYSFPEKVVAAGLAEEKEPVAYARGTLVLWARKDLAVPLSVDLLTDERVKRVAVADEIHAPYGRAAYAAMRWMKVLDKVQGKLVRAENVGQAAQFVESGNAQMGFVSLTLAESAQMKSMGSYVRVPAVYPVIRQCGVVMKKSKQVEEGRRFLAWMTSREVQGHMKDFGLEAVE